MSQRVRDLAKNDMVKTIMRDIAIAMMSDGVRYVDVTVGGAGVSLSMRVFLTSAQNADGVKVSIGKKHASAFAAQAERPKCARCGADLFLKDAPSCPSCGAAWR